MDFIRRLVREALATPGNLRKSEDKCFLPKKISFNQSYVSPPAVRNSNELAVRNKIDLADQIKSIVIKDVIFSNIVAEVFY